MSIALVGPTSYIAEHLASTLEAVDKEYCLVSLRNKGAAVYTTKRRVVFCDELTKGSVEDMAISSAVICASMSAKDCERDPERAHYINTRKVLDVVEALAAGGAKRFMYLSTIKVYGEDLEGRVTERTDERPSTIYAKTHYDTEVALRELAARADVEVLVVRLSNVFGAPVGNQESAWSLAANCFARQIASKGSIDVKNPEIIRNILPMGKLVSFITGWLDKSIETNTVELVNIGSGTTLSMKDLAELVKGCYVGDIGEADIDLIANTKRGTFQYSTDLSLRMTNRREEEDNNLILLEMRRLCDASKELFGKTNV